MEFDGKRSDGRWPISLSNPICWGFWLRSDFAEIYTCHTLSHFRSRRRKWEEKREEWRKSWLCGHRSFFVYFHLLINAMLSLCTRQFGLLGVFSSIDIAWQKEREPQTRAIAFFTKNCIVPLAIDCGKGFVSGNLCHVDTSWFPLSEQLSEQSKLRIRLPLSLISVAAIKAINLTSNSSVSRGFKKIEVWLLFWLHKHIERVCPHMYSQHQKCQSSTVQDPPCRDGA